MLKRQEIERMRAAIEKNLVEASETYSGECIAVDDETGQEWGHEFCDGKAFVHVESENDIDPGLEYIFAIQVIYIGVKRVE